MQTIEKDKTFFIRQRHLMMHFSTGTGLERVGVVGPDLDCWRAGLRALGSSGLRQDRCNAGLQALDRALLCKNEEERSARALPAAAQMPKSVSF